jgi:hypothetical protein
MVNGTKLKLNLSSLRKSPVLMLRRYVKKN